MRLVAIVGRPNVGKSTLFNRLVGKRVAIVEDVPGVTRDRRYAAVDWGDRRFTLVDTGGLDPDPAGEVAAGMTRQALLAVEEADLILFVTDVREGVLPADEEIARGLRRRSKDVVLVANKADGPRWETAAAEFYALGFERVLPVSAEHGRGLEELEGEVRDRLPEADAEPPEADEQGTRVAVLGRPNVGKSSLVNRLLGEERVVVSAEAGTTRDPVDTLVRRDGRPYLLIDTAGIRRRSRVEKGVERWSVVRALRTVDRAHVCLVLLDATEGLTDQDARILNLVLKGGRALGIVLNKWDLVEKDEKTFDRTVAELRRRLGPHGHVPVVSMSALTGQRVHRVFDLVDTLYREWTRRIPTSQVNAFLEATLRELPPPVKAGKRTRIYYMTQVRTAPPTFAAFTSFPEGISESYHRFLVNRLRDAFGFAGVPVRLEFRRRTRPGEEDR
ncbi:ribosome biogenesis GTPase Der [Deferrisoma camini]|uniref:ribosome biogenesis GTPase Der n=1 Tax=Deferrisoma camini TaxID=1035120 RepID=UPI00046D9084|nr:ribosome biogenesis GTPase Der [Deferrisoma camini]